jgi:hypothetical protein
MNKTFNLIMVLMFALAIGEGYNVPGGTNSRNYFLAAVRGFGERRLLIHNKLSTKWVQRF